MKIQVTKRNLKMVAGLLNKFFNHPTKGFTRHHNFNCGWKNIKPYKRAAPQLFSNAKIDVEIDFPITKDSFLRLVCNDDSVDLVMEGTFLEMHGNKITLQQPQGFLEQGVPFITYTVFTRVGTLTEEDREEIERKALQAKMDYEMYDRIYSEAMDDDYDYLLGLRY